MLPLEHTGESLSATYQQILLVDEIKENDIMVTILFWKKSSAYKPHSLSRNTCR
jgi:hypothetical protein